MKVLFLSDDFPPQSFGGAGISTYELAKGMKEAGQEVFVITTCRKESEISEYEYEGMKIFKIASEYPDRWRSYVSLYNKPVVKKVEALLKTIKPDVVHANNIHQHLSYYCLKIARKHSKAVVFTARDVMTFNYGKLATRRYLDNFETHTTWIDHINQAGKRWNPLRNWLIKKYLAYADKIFAISKALKDALVQNGIDNVEVIYNGIDLSEWQCEESLVDSFRQKYNLQGKRVLLFSGRLSAAKGGDKAVESLALIAREMPNVVLLVAGSIDWYANTMKEFAKSLDIEEKIIFTGWIGRDDIKIAYAVADIVLMPPIHLEAFGRVNIEAMAAKKPLVASCYGATPEIVEDGVTGYIVNPLYPEQIAEKTSILLKDFEKAKKFGEAGFNRAKKHFNLEDKVTQYIAVYNGIINEI